MEQTLKLKDYALMGATHEGVSRFGSAISEALVGLRGVNNETGQVMNHSLREIAGWKINPEYAERNIKQQAGYSAEIHRVTKGNQEAIINRTGSRFSRSEDLPGYGKNHTVVDIVELMPDGEAITSQMKFVSNQEGLLQKIACGEGGGKNDLSRYLDVDKLEVPTEQVGNMKEICRKEAASLRQQAQSREAGNPELAVKLRKRADNYEKLEGKIADSGMTTEEAIALRLHPEWKTFTNIVGVSHRAGIEGAKTGAVIGGSIALMTNMIAVYSGDKKFGDAVMDSGKETLVAAGVGYGTAFTGSVIKGYMQQSGSVITRNLAKTGLPAAIFTVCLATGKSIRKYANGEIDEAALVQEMGLTASGLLSSSTFTMLGQIAIPVPVLGGLIGGMVGYALTNTFYQSFFDVLKEAKAAAARREIIEMQCATARALAQQYEQALQTLFREKLAALDTASRDLFAVLDNPTISGDAFCTGMNRFAAMLGQTLTINSMAELDEAMLSENTLII